MQIGCQIYVKGSVEAVAFYQRAFGWTIGMNFINPDGAYAHASLMSGKGSRKREMLAVAEDKVNTGSPDVADGEQPIMQFSCWDLKSREAVDQAYSVLSEGVRSTRSPDGPAAVPWNDYCFGLVDKFGVHWWVAI